MPDIALTGLGAYLPKLAHTDATLPPLDRPLPADHRARIGVERRYWADERETVPAMAAAAARRALDQAQCAPSDVDLVIVVNWTERRYLPDLAPEVAERLGAERALAFDLGCACAGFILGLAAAQALLQRSDLARAVVVASETTSRRARPGSNATLVYSDGAGAVVLERGSPPAGRLLDVVVHTDAAHRGIMDIDEHSHVRTYVPQRELVAHAARSLAVSAEEIMRRNRLTPDHIDWFVPHSGTAAIQSALRETSAIKHDRILTNFDQVGNLSSASIPAALAHFRADGTIGAGDLVLCAAVGSGWYRAGALLRM